MFVLRQGIFSRTSFHEYPPPEAKYAYKHKNSRYKPISFVEPKTPRKAMYIFCSSSIYTKKTITTKHSIQWHRILNLSPCSYQCPLILRHKRWRKEMKEYHHQYRHTLHHLTFVPRHKCIIQKSIRYYSTFDSIYINNIE